MDVISFAWLSRKLLAAISSLTGAGRLCSWRRHEYSIIALLVLHMQIWLKVTQAEQYRCSWFYFVNSGNKKITSKFVRSRYSVLLYGMNTALDNSNWDALIDIFFWRLFIRFFCVWTVLLFLRTADLWLVTHHRQPYKFIYRSLSLVCKYSAESGSWQKPLSHVRVQNR